MGGWCTTVQLPTFRIEFRWTAAKPLSGSHDAIMRPWPRSDVNLLRSGARTTGTLVRNRRVIFSRILIEWHGFVSSTPSSGWRAMKFVQLCSIEHFLKSTIHPWQRPAGKYRSDGRVETGTSAVRHCWVPSRGSAGEIIREPQQRAGRPIWAIAAIPLVQFV